MAARFSRDAGFGAEKGSPIKRGISKVRFEAIFTEGKSVNSPLFRISALPGTGKVGIAVAKSVGNAPARNRQRRRVREAIRKEKLSAAAKLDYVVSVRAAAEKIAFEDFASELAKALRAVNARWESE